MERYIPISPKCLQNIEVLKSAECRYCKNGNDPAGHTILECSWWHSTRDITTQKAEERLEKEKIAQDIANKKEQRRKR